MIKRCRDCYVEKDLEQFHKLKASKDGYAFRCKECEHINYKYKKSLDPEKHNLRAKLWARKMLEKNPNYAKDYYEKNKEKRKEIYKRYRDKNRQKVNARTKVGLWILKGKLIKPVVCEICKRYDEKLEAHHEDYSKALDITWCCLQCHHEEDMKRKRQKDLEMYETMKRIF